MTTTTVVKIGGSLSRNHEVLKVLCQKLSLLAKNHRLVVVPGGGRFADCVREFDKRYSLSLTVTHRMAVLAMDQYGLLLSDLIPECLVVDSLEGIKNGGEGRVAVFLPSSFLFVDNGLPNSWEVTSDSIAAYIAGKIGAGKLLLLKDVDGIFDDDPKRNPNAKRFDKLTIPELIGLGETCVDIYLPNLLEKLSIQCCILNGLYPERVASVLSGQETVGTSI